MDLAARDGLTPIYRAAMAGEAKVVRMLDQLGADLDSVCKAGNRPLHAACFGGHTQVPPPPPRACLARYGSPVTYACAPWCMPLLVHASHAVRFMA